jgi:hypothetical protein
LITRRNKRGREPLLIPRIAASVGDQEGTMLANHRVFYLVTFLSGALIGMGAAYAWAL